MAILSCGGWLAPVLRAAEPPAAAAEEIVTLAPLTVVDSRYVQLQRLDENWLYGRIGEFEVLSNASRRDTEDYMRRMYRFHLLFTELFPTMNVAKRRPVTLVFCGRRDAFDSIRPQFSDDPAKNAVTFFVRDREQALIGLDLEMRETLIAEGTGFGHDVGAAIMGDEENPFQHEPVDPERQVQREYVRFALGQGEKRAPAWLEEGIAQLLAIAELDGTTLRFGRLKRHTLVQMDPVPGDPYMKSMGKAESLDELSMYFDKKGFMPFGEFLAKPHDSDDARNAVGGLFAMQALVFTHYSLYADSGRNQKAFQQFIARLADAPPTEEVFRACYGKGYKEFQRDLRGYLGGGRYRSAVSRNFVLPAAPELELRDAKPVEWLRVKADALRLVGRTADAAVVLQTALNQQVTDARMYASVGFLQQQRDHPAEALLAFRNAVQAKVDLPGPYIELARNRLTAALGPDRDRTLPKQDFVAIMRLLMTARERARSPRRDLYEALATTWVHAPVAPKNENLALLEEGVLAFPSDVPLVADTAELKRRIGRLEDANALAQLGLKVAADDPTRERFSRLEADTRTPAKTPR